MESSQTVSPEARKLESLLARESFGRFKDIRLAYLRSVDSTQNYMAQVKNSDREADLVISEIQTQGKGREGRSWVSGKGGLWLTITLKPPSSHVLEEIVKIGSTAIKKTLEEYKLNGLAIKPPNDVYCNGKKIAGLLADSVVQGDNYKVHLGVGIDVNNNVSDPSISQLATSVRKELGRPVNLPEFTVSFLKNLDTEYSRIIKSQ